MKYLLALSLFCFCSACSNSEKGAVERTYTYQSCNKAPAAKEGLSHKIYAVKTNTFINCQTLLTELSNTQLIILGEQHGNAEHHQAEQLIFTGLLETAKPALVMEMLTTDKQSLIDSHNQPEKDAANKLAVALEWWKSAWPAFSNYEPLIQAAFNAKLPIIAGDIDDKQQQNIRKKGRMALPDPLRRELKLNTLPLQAAKDSWETSMSKAHCDLLEPEQIKHVAELQRVRDAHMAKQALKTLEQSKQVVLIAGRAHARHDRSVPRQLNRLTDNAPSTKTIQFVAAKKDQTDPKTYLPTDAFGPTYDYIWFTSIEDKLSPCDRFRELKKGAK